MATMSHTKEERKLWHAGKARVQDGAWSRLRKAISRSNGKGAWTPSWMKRGIVYEGTRVEIGQTAREALFGARA